MTLNLRKGSTAVELWHKYGSELITAKNTEVELMSDYAIFRTTLKPVDDNQKYDADETLNNHGLKKITIHDQRIYSITTKFLNAYNHQIKYIKFELNYGKKYSFRVLSLKQSNDDNLIFDISE